MGKGDKRSRKGKVWRGSYGKTRPRKESTKTAFVPKAKTKKLTAPIKAMLEEIPAGEVMEGTETEVKAAKPKKAAAPKKPKVEGEKKAPAKKKKED